jgi:uncharacterized membrane protein (DUF4010 family)
MADLDLVADIAIAFAIGLLIGLQREQSGKGILAAGSRTFPLVAIAGAVCQAFLPSVLVAAYAGVVLLAALGYLARVREVGDPGLATPVASCLTFLFGAMSVASSGAQLAAVILAVVTTVILALKEPLHGFARRLSTAEIRATLSFLVIALVVLPLLPDRQASWLLGLNPRFVWMMVVFVAAIDLAAYLFVKAFATRRGHLLAGVVGGLVSSTATTVSMARQTRARPDLSSWFGVGIIVASAVMLVRMAVEVAALNPSLLLYVGPPLGLLFAWCLAIVVLLLRHPAEGDGEGTGPRNPFRLTPALMFGLFFATVLLLTRWLNEGFGQSGVYLAAIVSGFVDVDAVTLSLASLEASGAVGRDVAATGMLLVAASNFCFKILLVLALGTRKLALRTGAALAAAPLVAALALAWGLP